MQWKNLSEHTVYENPWLGVNLADVELPDGRHLAHYLIRQRPVALATAVNDRAEVLLLWRHRFITDTWGYERAAGVVEDGETLLETTAREMLEETGWRPIAPLRHLVTVEPSNGLSDAAHHVYWCEGAEEIGPPGGPIRSSNALAALLLLHRISHRLTVCAHRIARCRRRATG